MVTPVVPPYAHLDQEAVQCIALASSRYAVPELLLHAILAKENGRTGRCTRNSNGTSDCGLAQINTSWAAFFAKQGVPPAQVFFNACTNIAASAYILKYHFIRKGQSWPDAIISYNIGPNRWTPARYRIGAAYAQSVIHGWRGYHAWVTARDRQSGAPELAGADAP